MFCAKCGTKIESEDANFCEKCGTPLRKKKNFLVTIKFLCNRISLCKKKYIIPILVIFLILLGNQMISHYQSNEKLQLIEKEKQVLSQDPHNVNIREYLHDGAEIIQVEYAKVLNKDYTDIVLHSKVKRQKMADMDYFSVISYDKGANIFKRVFETSIEQPNGFQRMKVGEFFDDGRSAIIISWGHGNTGGMENYSVYGAVKSKVSLLLQGEAQQVFFKNNKIVEPYWDQAKYYSWDGNKLQETPVLFDLERKEYDDNSVKVEYYLNDNDEIVLKNNIQKIDMKIGQKLFLARTNFGVPCKILYPSDAVKFEKDDFGYYELADKLGNYKITINVMGSKRYKKNIDLNITE